MCFSLEENDSWTCSIVVAVECVRIEVEVEVEEVEHKDKNKEIDKNIVKEDYKLKLL